MLFIFLSGFYYAYELSTPVFVLKYLEVTKTIFICLLAVFVKTVSRHHIFVCNVLPVSALKLPRTKNSVSFIFHLSRDNNKVVTFLEVRVTERKMM